MAKRSLGSSSAKHAAKALSLASSADRHARLALSGTCGIRFTSLSAAIKDSARASEHAFGSGGRVMKGAITSKTVTADDATQVYETEKRVREASDRFRRDCVSSDSLSGKRGR